MAGKRRYSSRAISKMPDNVFSRFYRMLCEAPEYGYARASWFAGRAGYPVTKAVVKRFVDNLLGPDLAFFPAWMAEQYDAHKSFSFDELLEQRRALMFLNAMVCQRIRAIDRATGLRPKGEARASLPQGGEGAGIHDGGAGAGREGGP